MPKHKLAFLPNPLAAAPTDETVAFTAPTVITVGRLVEQKGIDVLLAAWAKVVAALPDWRLGARRRWPSRRRAEGAGARSSASRTASIGSAMSPIPFRSCAAQSSS